MGGMVDSAAKRPVPEEALRLSEERFRLLVESVRLDGALGGGIHHPHHFDRLGPRVGSMDRFRRWR